MANDGFPNELLKNGIISTLTGIFRDLWNAFVSLHVSGPWAQLLLPPLVNWYWYIQYIIWINRISLTELIKTILYLVLFESFCSFQILKSDITLGFRRAMDHQPIIGRRSDWKIDAQLSNTNLWVLDWTKKIIPSSSPWKGSF